MAESDNWRSAPQNNYDPSQYQPPAFGYSCTHTDANCFCYYYQSTQPPAANSYPTYQSDVNGSPAENMSYNNSQIIPTCGPYYSGTDYASTYSSVYPSSGVGLNQGDAYFDPTIPPPSHTPSGQSSLQHPLKSSSQDYSNNCNSEEIHKKEVLKFVNNLKEKSYSDKTVTEAPRNSSFRNCPQSSDGKQNFKSRNDRAPSKNSRRRSPVKHDRSVRKDNIPLQRKERSKSERNSRVTSSRNEYSYNKSKNDSVNENKKRSSSPISDGDKKSNANNTKESRSVLDKKTPEEEPSSTSTTKDDASLMGFTPHDIIEFLEESSSMSEDSDTNHHEDPEFGERPKWIRLAPAELYYEREYRSSSNMKANQRLMNLCHKFTRKLVDRGERYKSAYKDKRKESPPSSIVPPAIDKKEGTVTCDSTEVAHTADDQVKEPPADSIKDEAESVPCAQINLASHSDVKESQPTENSICNGSLEACELKANPTSPPPAPCSPPATETKVEPNGLNIPTVPNKECNDLLTQCLKKPPVRTKKVVKKSSDPACSKCANNHCSSSSTSDSSDDEIDWVTKGAEEMEKKQKDPDRLHPDLWFNDPGQMNDGPLCRCSAKARRSGIRHGYFAGEEKLEPCSEWSNNADRLYHYIVTISPPTNFLIKNPTVIVHDDHEFIFEGFSILSHSPLEDIPPCQVLRFNTEYTIFCVKEQLPENYCIKELQLFFDYVFKEILELEDFSVHAIDDEEGCPRFHFMPRFVRSLPGNGKEILSMNEVLKYLLQSSIPLIVPEELFELLNLSEPEWLNLTDPVKGMIVTFPGKKPSSLRVDQIDRDQLSKDSINYPVLVHFGVRPPQLSYAGDPVYQKAMKDYVKSRHLLANMPKPTIQDIKNLENEELKLQKMRTTSKIKRDVTVAISSQGAIRTGIMCDMVQHALLIPVLVRHLRFHQSLKVLEDSIEYKFKSRPLLQLALTHPSFRENFGTNPDHGRNSLSNCGVRQPLYGDRKIHYMNTHKRGINTLINIMSRFGKDNDSDSKITHNERLEFLGDAVVEFLTSIHLFHLFPGLEEGGLATYRAAIVQNQQLSELAEKLSLNDFVLRAHGSDLCHQLELKHAMANCFEALMGAIFIDSSIEEADAVFSATLFKGEEELHQIWVNYNFHPLQEQEPHGDRKWIEKYPFLQKLTKFEGDIGIEFQHIRLLARAFTDRSIGFTLLTLGSNQRLEFLGDTVLQLVASEYLYRYFPEHHEGHLSLLRSSLVNNRTQSIVCDELQMTKYSAHSQLKPDLKVKDRADLLEAFIGSLYIDKGLDHCRVFASVCFFPKLEEFILNQTWNDPKSKLQQCCLTLRTMEGGEPDIPIYRVIECKGPTNTRVYSVAVYFKEKRLAKASGHSIQQAEMNAANAALENNKELFPHLVYQQRVIEKSKKLYSFPIFSKKLKSLAKESEKYLPRKRSRRRGIQQDPVKSKRDASPAKTNQSPSKGRRPERSPSSKRSRRRSPSPKRSPVRSYSRTGYSGSHSRKSPSKSYSHRRSCGKSPSRKRSPIKSLSGRSSSSSSYARKSPLRDKDKTDRN